MSVQVDAEVINVTASFGVSEIMSNDETIESMFERSDKRLYMAKESGRNAVVFT
jgi:diguanylate cyclase (GGDEF)-like protein